MAGRRIQRLNEQLKREISALLRGEVRDPRIGAVTVTGVETSADLSYARVHVVSLDASARRDEILAGLAAAGPYLRGELGRRLHVRRVPELDFRWDASFEHAQRIERLIGQVRAERERTGEATGGEPEDREGDAG